MLITNKPIEDYQEPFDMQRDVHNFMVAAEQVVGYKPGLRDQLLRIRLISEEANELCRAIYADNMIETIDGICDLIYVTLGASIAFGIPIEPFWNEIHKSNMLKTNNIIRDEFGKVTKPEGWKKPDIIGIFTMLYGDISGYPSDIQSHDNGWQSLISELTKKGITPQMVLDKIGDTKE